ncbi:MAG: metal dependent phosphohydrolase [Herbinix sp.]|jgi:HD-GYP domain-containing protein (c-di-GMP phosphodiesterase class II)|nr:metal dependent phosphohydrolase [Herbinix sp.]
MIKKDSILRPVKRIIIIIIAAFFLILVSFTILQHQTSRMAYEDKQVINLFGKQRMFTQQISKDSSRLYALMQSLSFDQIYQSEDIVKGKIQMTKKSLQEAEINFAKTLAAMQQGILIVDSDQIDITEEISQSTDTLDQIALLWSEFAKAVDTLIASDEITDQMAAAAIYINENNLELLQLSDNISVTILNNSIQKANDMKLIIYGMIGLLSVITLLALYHLIKFIYQPFQQLYKGITEIGLDTNSGDRKLPTKKNVMPMVTEINEMFLKINDLISLIENMNNNSSFTETLQFIYDTFSTFIPYTYIGIALIDENKKFLRASYGVSDDSIIGMPDKIVGKSWLIKDTSLGNLIETGEARIINDLEEYTSHKPIKAYNQILLEAGIRSSITLPLKVAGEPVGVIFFSSHNKNVYQKKHVNFLMTLVNSIAISFNQNIFISDLLYSSILALAKMAEARDEDTGEHLDRMKIYSRVIAELLYEKNLFADEINAEYIDKIERFSPLHDIGKVGIRDGILLKPGKLTKEEFQEMKHHALYGAEVLRSAEMNIMKRGKSLFLLGIEIAEDHHEKWDGSGYPYGKKGNEIALSARIVALADVFDALTSRRPYKEPFSFEKSFDIIREGMGKHFDPVIAGVFLENEDRIRRVYQSFLIQESHKNDIVA